MIDLNEAKEFLRVDNDDEDTTIATLAATAESLVEDILRQKLSDFETVPSPIKQAALILLVTLYEERQVSKDRTGLDMSATLDLVRRMVFAYRKESF